MFNVKRFSSLLNTQWLGRQLWFFNEIASTNAYLQTKKNRYTAHGLTCIADNQRQGRGLYGKNWVAEPGRNLTFTTVFKPQSNDCLQTLSLMCAFSVCDVFYQHTGLDFTLKWPNDVYYKNQKVGGLLTETSFTGTKLDRILLGIGLNINQIEFPEELKEKACSLSQMNNKQEFPREVILAQILDRIEQNYKDWENRDDLLIKSINRKIIGYGDWVKLQVDGQVLDDSYKLLGINSRGLMHVLNQNDDVKVFTHEEVRIHPNSP
ncbi:MAG: biotin--[acetyl-CoA-carboxylase] ligase [Balneolales bacterium]